MNKDRGTCRMSAMERTAHWQWGRVNLTTGSTLAHYEISAPPLGWRAPRTTVVKGADAQTCPRHSPTRVILTGPGGDHLEPLDRVRVGTKKVEDQRGCEHATIAAAVAFDWGRVQALSETWKSLTVTIEFSKGQPVEFEFNEEDLEQLVPAWAHTDTGREAR